MIKHFRSQALILLIAFFFNCLFGTSAFAQGPGEELSITVPSRVLGRKLDSRGFYTISIGGQNVARLYVEPEDSDGSEAGPWAEPRSESSRISIQLAEGFTLPSLLDALQQNSTVTPTTLYDPFGDKKLEMTRRQWVETQTTPPFYSIYSGERPLSVFILPIVHTLPWDALPLYLQEIVQNIARQPGAVVIGEVGEDYYASQEDDSNLDPRFIFNVDDRVQRDLERYMQFVEESDPAMRDSRRRTEEERLRTLYEAGWATSLPPEDQETLRQVIAYLDEDLSLETLNTLDPQYVWNYLLKVQGHVLHQSKPFLALDDSVQEIFRLSGRGIHSLEDEDGRESADDEAYSTDIAENYLTLAVCQLLIKDVLGNLKDGIKTLKTPASPRSLSLGDLDFGCPYQMTYLRGDRLAFSPPSVSLDERNQLWWNETIQPLLEERAGWVGERPAPVLMTYGAGHNEGPFSIIDLIARMPGFEVRKLVKSSPF